MKLRRADILRDRLGLWVWDTSMQGIRATVIRARRQGVNWIAVKAQDGGSGYRLNTQQLEVWRRECRHNGIQFGIWGFLYGANPRREAETAIALVNNYGADFYIADAESGYEIRPAASAVFCHYFAEGHPHLPKCISSFGRIDLHPHIDWHTWRRHGFTFMPQAYADASPLLRPSSCIEVASRIWHPSEMAVTLEASPHFSTVDYGRWIREAAHQGVSGFNIWRADLASNDLLATMKHNR